MLQSIRNTISLTFLLASLARADPVPTAPDSSSIFNEGTTCTIQWTADSTGLWNPMNIELMAGPNLNMEHISTVASNIDGTDPSKNTFSYPCLDVTPHAPIYFYQFTSPNAPNTTWTTRFTIAGSDGSKTSAPNATQPDGSAIAWGTATLTDPSQAVAAPAKPGSGSSSASVSTGGSGASLAVSTPSAAPSATSIAATGLPTSGAAPGPVSLPSSIVQTPSSSNVASGTSTPVPTSSSAASPLLATTLSIVAPLLSLLSLL